MTSHNPPTTQQLDDIETRANAATPGPWCTDSWEIYQGGEDGVPDLMKWVGETCRAEDTEGSRNDAAFIAHARTDVPLLLAEVRRLNAVLTAIRHLHKDSPMGPCPVCINADAGVDEDPTVPWPCPTARLAGAVDIEPPHVRAAAGSV